MSIDTREDDYLVLARFSSIPACEKMLAPGPLADPLPLGPARSSPPPENKFIGTKMHCRGVGVSYGLKSLAMREIEERNENYLCVRRLGHCLKRLELSVTTSTSQRRVAGEERRQKGRLTGFASLRAKRECRPPFASTAPRRPLLAPR